MLNNKATTLLALCLIAIAFIIGRGVGVLSGKSAKPAVATAASGEEGESSEPSHEEIMIQKKAPAMPDGLYSIISGQKADAYTGGFVESPLSDFRYRVTDDGLGLYVQYVGSSGIIGFPKEIAGLPVHEVSIAMSKKHSGMDIFIPDGVKRIRGFSGLSIRNIYIPASLARIDSEAFADCDITDIAIPSSCALGTGIFRNASFNKVTWPFPTCPDETFSGCRKLMGVTFTQNARIVGTGAFQGCASLVTVKFESDKMLVKNRAFRNDSRLETIAGVESLSFESTPNSDGKNTDGYWNNDASTFAFSGCTGLSIETEAKIRRLPYTGAFPWHSSNDTEFGLSLV